MNEFERTEVQVEGRFIMITSWLDVGAGVLRASAPECLHLLHNLHSDAITGGSRQQAVKRMTDALSQALGHA